MLNPPPEGIPQEIEISQKKTQTNSNFPTKTIKSSKINTCILKAY